MGDALEEDYSGRIHENHKNKRLRYESYPR
jgi:hypothetical protein